MLLCDECNAGTHMFCLKPKLRSVPPGNWYCNDCVKSLGLSNGQNEKDKKQATKKKRKFIVEEEDDEATDEEEEEKKDDDMTDEDAEHENEKHDEDVEDDESVTSTPSSSRVNGRILRRPRTRPTSRRLTSKEIEEHAQEDVDSGDVSDDASLTAGEDTIEDESDEEKVCQKCFYDGGEIKCVQCRLFFHLECVHLKRPPRTDFVCKTCKPMPQRPRRRHSNMNGDHDRDEEEPKAKRPRNSLRLSIDKTARPSNGNNNNNNNNSSVNNNNHRRSGRRTNEHMPLNSAALYDLLEQIMKHKAAWPFLRPVLTSEVPDYHQIIKTPMDLAKIKSKLNMGAYQLNEELLSDIQLVFRNCDLYNVEGNEIYDAGCQLERFVIDRCRDMQLPFRPSDMNGEVKAC
nr:LD09043p [Drosophila melanogaster]